MNGDPAGIDDADLVATRIELPGGPLEILQPSEWADLPDDGGVEWAPIAPYWAVLWRSGVALAAALGDPVRALAGKRVLELGCGLAVPSLAAARAGAEVLATDRDPDAIVLAALNARALGLPLRTATADFTAGDALAGESPFDLVLGADLLYETGSDTALIELLPRVGKEALLASPARAPFARMLAGAPRSWTIERTSHGVIEVARIGF